MKKLTGTALTSALKPFKEQHVAAQSIKKRNGWFKHTAVALAAVAIMGLTACNGDNNQLSTGTGKQDVIATQADTRYGNTPIIHVYPKAEILVEGVHKNGADHEQIYHFDGSRVYQSSIDGEVTSDNIRRSLNRSQLRLYQQIVNQGKIPENAPGNLPPVEIKDGNYRIEVMPNNQIVAEYFNINGVQGSRIWFFDNSDIVVHTFGNESSINRISSTDAHNYRDLKANLMGSTAASDTIDVSVDENAQSVSKNITINGKQASLTWEFANETRRSGKLTFTMEGKSTSVPISTARSGFTKQMRKHLQTEKITTSQTSKPRNDEISSSRAEKIKQLQQIRMQRRNRS